MPPKWYHWVKILRSRNSCWKRIVAIDCLCTGILFSDVVCSPVDKAPDEGGLVAAERIELALGGCASNTALDLARLGVNVGASGCVGRDVFGQFILDQLSNGGVNVAGIRQLQAPFYNRFGTLLNNYSENFLQLPLCRLAGQSWSVALIRLETYQG